MSYYLSFFFLLLSLSMDTFLAAVSFGISNIKVPIYSIIILSFINTLFLIIACFLGEYIKIWIPISMIRILSSFPFFILGYLKIKTSKNLHFLQTEQPLQTQAKYLLLIEIIIKNYHFPKCFF